MRLGSSESATNWSRPRDGLFEVVPAWAPLAAVGTALVVGSLWNLARELTHLRVEAGPIAAFALAAIPAVVVVAAALKLRGSDLDRADRWAVALGGLTCGLVAGGAEGLTFVIRFAEGRPVAEPQFPLLVMSGTGVVAGVLIGWEYVRVRSASREAREARDAMAFTNSMLRHDVLNGIQVIQGHADLLRDHDDEAVRDRGEAIESQADSLVTLVTEVRSVSAVLTGDADVEPVDLSAMLSETIETVRESHAALTVDTDIAPDLRVRGADALQPVFSNLLTNAAQHAGSPATVRVSATQEGDTVTVRVADDGPGIPEERRERIFERGVSTDGGGQGLYVVDTIVDRLGGDVTVEESELGGAAFVVTLPAAT